MKKWILYAIPVLAMTFVYSCSDDEEDALDGNWVKKSDFDGDQRSSSVVFVIGNIAYVGTGYNGSDDEYYQDFWKYDAELNFWQQVAAFPGPGRSSAVAFAIGDKGYVGTGFDGNDELQDFWEYDSRTDTWTQKNDFAGTARRSAVAFTVGGKGYIGTGYDGSELKDFWEYDPEADTWAQVPSIGGSKRRDAVAFVLNDKAYVGTGTNNGLYVFDFWQFDPELQAAGEFPWVAKRDIDYDDDYNIYRAGAVAFTVGDAAYVAAGSNGYSVSTVWEYWPGTDTWVEKTGFEGTSRTDAVAFTLNGRGFAALGNNSTLYFDDIWEFRPYEEYDDED